MEAELVVLTVTITSDGFTVLSYQEQSGQNHTAFDNLSLEAVVKIFERVKYDEMIPALTEGTGSRVNKLDFAMTPYLKEAFGFNKVGAIVHS